MLAQHVIGIILFGHLPMPATASQSTFWVFLVCELKGNQVFVFLVSFVWCPEIRSREDQSCTGDGSRPLKRKGCPLLCTMLGRSAISNSLKLTFLNLKICLQFEHSFDSLAALLWSFRFSLMFIRCNKTPFAMIEVLFARASPCILARQTVDALQFARHFRLHA